MPYRISITEPIHGRRRICCHLAANNVVVTQDWPLILRCILPRNGHWKWIGRERERARNGCGQQRSILGRFTFKRYHRGSRVDPTEQTNRLTCNLKQRNEQRKLVVSINVRYSPSFWYGMTIALLLHIFSQVST